MLPGASSNAATFLAASPPGCQVDGSSAAVKGDSRAGGATGANPTGDPTRCHATQAIQIILDGEVADTVDIGTTASPGAPRSPQVRMSRSVFRPPLRAPQHRRLPGLTATADVAGGHG